MIDAIWYMQYDIRYLIYSITNMRDDIWYTIYWCMAKTTQTTQQFIIGYMSVVDICTCTYIYQPYIPLFLMAKYVTTPTRHPRHPEFQTTTRPSLFKPWGRITSPRMMRIQGHYGGNYTSFNPSQTASGRYGRSLPTFHWDVWVMHRACHHFQVGHSHAQNSSAVGSPLNLPGIPAFETKPFQLIKCQCLAFYKNDGGLPMFGGYIVYKYR